MRLVLQVYLDPTLSSPNKNSVLDYLATKPEVEGFRDQGVVLPEVEILRVQSLWLLKETLPSSEQPDIYSILNSKTRFYTLTLYACFISPKRGSALNTRSNDFIKYQLSLDVQRFLWVVYYIALYYIIYIMWVLHFASWGVMNPKTKHHG